MHIFFHKDVDNFGESTNHAKFWLGVQYEITTKIKILRDISFLITKQVGAHIIAVKGTFGNSLPNGAYSKENGSPPAW